jgi:rhodanese-related sulfurtransferase
MPKRNPGEPYYRLSIEEAAEMYGDDNAYFVDVRRPDEYVAGHIKGAAFITVDDLMARIDELPQDKKLLFICAAGVRSGLACEMAAALGFEAEKLYNIEEGTAAWIAKGKPTSYGDEK